MADDNCHICAMVANAEDASTVYRDDLWTATAAIGVPGWVMLCANRHAEGGWGLSKDEATSFGPLYSAVSSALRDVCDAECVYMLYLGENALHFHALAVARGADAPPEHRGPGIVAKMPELANSEEALKLVPPLRDAVAATLGA
jgi:diadenosine tetraphosphate (Ap4A) HIT family hydrolase